MSTLAGVLVALPVAVFLYAYAAYPLLLWILTRRGQTRAGGPDHLPARELPMVTIVVPAYNEAAQIGGALEALLEQDYPADRRQILVLSDASTDGTDDIVRSFAPRGVELLRMPARSGKTAAENASCPLLRGDIIVNTDASIRLHPAAVRELVAHMADPRVGVASSRDLSVASRRGAANTTEAGYVGFEMWLRGLETRLGGIVGASGSGYAIRAELHKLPVPDDLSRDFSAALTARRHGYRAVSVDSALCYVPRTASLGREYKRKVRTISRGMDTLLHNRELLNPFRYGLFAWKLLSHKVSRWLLPLVAIPGVLGLGVLAMHQEWPRVVLAIIGAGVALAATGALWSAIRKPPRVLGIAAFGMAANLAVIHALMRLVLGHHDHVWEPTRRSPAATARGDAPG